ncbi:MAG: histidine--tRNA ligase [Erysipelotrichaceae bacterium]|nr:histidine--tRNA ligase [Erysipelotrichaceae bacterium]
MAEKYQLPRGTQDFLGSDVRLWKKVENIIAEECDRYGYEEIRTPVFEHTEVFKTENDSSDMVTKEMYSFEDNGKRSLTLRPEGTKGVIRAFVEHKMYGNPAELPKKLYYMGPMFRYERPQKGRYRQFHQFGIEAIGAKNPLLDVEVIALGVSISRRLGIKNLRLLINTLGDEESRNRYRQALKDYFEPYLPQLCEDCRRRWELNPLRILDCKVDKDSPCFASAPVMRDYLNEASKEYFDKVLKALDDLGIEYVIDDRLVRGLDYYSNTVFEAVPVDAQGQQAAVFAGGQYDGLVDYFGGGPLPGIGFGMGLERIITLAQENGGLKEEERAIDAYVIAMGEIGSYGLKITQRLRDAGFNCETDYQKRSLKAQFKASDRLKARVIVILGEDEAASQTAVIKNTATREQFTVKEDELVATVEKILKGDN